MSSHREAPEISKDPVADNTDVYAFVSPDKPDTVTIITNYIPLENPAGGPNFFEFGDDVLYSIYIDNDGDAQAGHHLPVRVLLGRCGTRTRSSTTPARSRRSTTRTGTSASSTTSPARRDTTARRPSQATSRRRRATSAPARRPNYAALAQAAVHTLPSGETVFAGQRNDGFFVDLGAIFDLGDLRPFQNLHLIPSAAAVGVDPLANAQRPHDRDPDPDRAVDARREAADGRGKLELRARHLGGASRRSVRIIDSHPAR